MRNYNFVEVEFMAKLLYWTAVDVPNKVANDILGLSQKHNNNTKNALKKLRLFAFCGAVIETVQH